MNLYEFSKHNIDKYKKSLIQDDNSSNTIDYVSKILKIDISKTLNYEYEILINDHYEPLKISSIISLRNTIKKDITKEKSSSSFIRHINYLTDKSLHYTFQILLKEKIIREKPEIVRSRFKAV